MHACTVTMRESNARTYEFRLLFNHTDVEAFAAQLKKKMFTFWFLLPSGLLESRGNKEYPSIVIFEGTVRSFNRSKCILARPIS
jgi:hypothetical protein